MSNPYDTAKARKASVLGPTLKFNGELSADEDLLIQGRIEGSINHSSSLTIGESGHVKADISAEYIAVEGNVEGDIRGSQSVTVRETADINGNICSPTVSLLEGATFNGSIEMRDPAESATPRQTEKSRPAEAVGDKEDDGSQSQESADDGRAAAKTPAKSARKSATAA